MILPDTCLILQNQKKPMPETLAQPLEELAALIERFTGTDGIHQTALAPLSLSRASFPSEANYGVYEPSFCVIAQGSKRTLLADETYFYDPAHYLLASIELPIVSQIVEATPQKPYLGIRLILEPAQIASLMKELEAESEETHSPTGLLAAPITRGIAVSRIDAGLLDATIRLLRLLETPRDLRILAPLVTREILYRLLRGEQRGQLQRIASENSATQRIAHAIQWLKEHYAEPVRIEDIAREACMSPSGLHHYFKTITAMSPLQYQKQLRLQEARRLMLDEGLDAATAGYRVGYESASQFSREYSRLFDAPPRRDIYRLRESSQTVAIGV